MVFLITLPPRWVSLPLRDTTSEGLLQTLSPLLKLKLVFGPCSPSEYSPCFVGERIMSRRRKFDKVEPVLCIWGTELEKRTSPLLLSWDYYYYGMKYPIIYLLIYPIKYVPEKWTVHEFTTNYYYYYYYIFCVKTRHKISGVRWFVGTKYWYTSHILTSYI